MECLTTVAAAAVVDKSIVRDAPSAEQFTVVVCYALPGRNGLEMWRSFGGDKPAHRRLVFS